MDDTALAVGGVTVLAGLGKWLMGRVVKETDEKFDRLVERMNVMDAQAKIHHDLLTKLDGAVMSESWGLSAVVGKLSSNVERLTMVVERMDALANTRRPTHG